MNADGYQVDDVVLVVCPLLGGRDASWEAGRTCRLCLDCSKPVWIRASQLALLESRTALALCPDCAQVLLDSWPGAQVQLVKRPAGPGNDEGPW